MGSFDVITKNNVIMVLLFCFHSGSGPDGRITRKDIESFVPPKVAPVSEGQLCLFKEFFLCLL